MATVTASHFASRSSHVNSHGGSGSETKINLAQVGLRGQVLTHNGLRSLNLTDGIQWRSLAVAKIAANRALAASTDKASSKIVCMQGMPVVFVGAEVGPWSKTGGLGDVLGGLPPAMAVSINFHVVNGMLLFRFYVYESDICSLIVVQARGHRVMTVSPRYDQYKDAWDTTVVIEVNSHI